MIGLDTNVLVRYLAQDDAAQSEKANRLVESLSRKEAGFISLVVLVEMVWVIQGAYAASKMETVAIIHQLLQVDAFMVENREIVVQAVQLYEKSGADFADCLIARCAHHAGCSKIFTFDKKAAKTTGMTLLA